MRNSDCCLELGGLFILFTVLYFCSVKQGKGQLVPAVLQSGGPEPNLGKAQAVCCLFCPFPFND